MVFGKQINTGDNMVTYFAVKNEVGTAGKLIMDSDRDTREVICTLIDILQRKELLCDRDIANLLDIGGDELQRLPF